MSLSEPRYFNRELSWLEFNHRVLAESQNPANPLFERLRFLAIFESNLDEFYMVRVSGLVEQDEAGITEPSPDGLTPREQLAKIGAKAYELRVEADRIWREELAPKLKGEGVEVLPWDSLKEAERNQMDEYFNQMVKPLLTPLLIDPAPSVAFISNRSLNLLVVIRVGNEMKLGRVKVPLETRLVPLEAGRMRFILLEELIKANIATLFPGADIVGVHEFRLIRDADMELRWLEAADLVSSLEHTIHQRRFGDPVLLQLKPDMPTDVRKRLRLMLALESEDELEVSSLLDLEVLHEVYAVLPATGKFAPHRPRVDKELATSDQLFERLKKSDVFVHLPYDSFQIVQEFVGAAARDPAVIGIKQTLYRVGKESPVVEALMEAARERKQVAVMVELKARFDETNNITWARALEREGVHVSYGFLELKTHCKLCLVVRREAKAIRLYAHIGSGNYNPGTARHYTDFGLFTSDPEITEDVGTLFNFLTGFATEVEFKKLLVAPHNLREEVLAKIEREAKLKSKGRLIFKLNSLVDPEMIDALYEASHAGVQIDIIARGICCLVPQVPGMSENIWVRSIVGRFLEHSRLYYFGNGGQPECYFGSADLMRRNLDRRVEVLAPTQTSAQAELLRDEILEPYLSDTANAWELMPSGEYKRVSASGKPFAAQQELMQRPFPQAKFS